MTDFAYPTTHPSSEGWDIFESAGSVDGPFQIQRNDEDAVFADDSEAWRFVWDKAQGGSAYHKGALDWLREHNPGEVVRIEHWSTTGNEIPRDPKTGECLLPLPGEASSAAPFA